MGSIYSVTQLNAYLKSLVMRDGLLSRICVKGEISECKYHSSGHIYFTLKDEGAQVSCTLFAGNRAGLTFRLEKGQSVIVSGAVSVYEKGGTYSINVRDVELAGEGALYAELERLKKKLAEEGYFDPSHKKQLPPYIKTLGIVTAGTGAALQDIINISRRRNPYVQLVLSPAKVQGEGAAASVIRALKKLDAYGVDVIIVGRGGGSIEDLWAFNDEELAKTVYALDTPVISAVGHETDTTLIDFVSDMRAPTPSAAAELAVYEYAALRSLLVDYHYDLFAAVNSKIAETREKIAAVTKLVEYNNPVSRLDAKKQELDRIFDRISELLNRKIWDTRDALENMSIRLERLVRMSLDNTRHRLSLDAEKLRRLSPLEKISEGYGYVSCSGRQVKSVDDVKTGEKIDIALYDGVLGCRIETIEHEYIDKTGKK